MSLAVPVEATASPGLTIASAMWNSGVRDAVNFLAGPPLAALFQTTAQSIASGAITAVAFDSETADTYGGHSNTVNNSQYVAQVAGWYLVASSLTYPSASTGVRQVMIYRNGAAVLTAFDTTPANASTTVGVTTAALVYLNVGDYVQTQTFQNQGSAQSLVTLTCAMNVLWVHS